MHGCTCYNNIIIILFLIFLWYIVVTEAIVAINFALVTNLVLCLCIIIIMDTRVRAVKGACSYINVWEVINIICT